MSQHGPPTGVAHDAKQMMNRETTGTAAKRDKGHHFEHRDKAKSRHGPPMAVALRTSDSMTKLVN